VDYGVGAGGRNDARNSVTIAQIGFLNLDAICKWVNVGTLDCGRIKIIKIIKDNHFVSAIKAALGKMRAYESGASGDE